MYEPQAATGTADNGALFIIIGCIMMSCGVGVMQRSNHNKNK